MKINENFLKLKAGYLFPEIVRRKQQFISQNPEKAEKVIHLGIGDVTRPIPELAAKVMKETIDEFRNPETFKGYGPEVGYDFVRERISEFVYKRRNIDIAKDEIFVSEGINADISNFTDLFAKNTKIAVSDPVYPVYVDTNVMAGNTGEYNEESKGYDGIIYMPLTEENNFKLELPKEKIDVIYLCSPNNPTGEAMTKEELKKFVDFANENKAIILYDGAYEAYIQDKEIPHSIYEIEGAKNCAIEFKSFSKDASFAGVRFAYCVIPKEIKGYTEIGEEVSINSLWNRRHSTKQNGCSYIVQKAAAALLSEEGQTQIQANLEYYRKNAEIILEGLNNAKIKARGGINSPYIWFKVPEGYTSWEYFDYLLNEKQIVSTPGSGFGPAGEGYIRLSAFGSRENTIEAVRRLTEK